MGERGGGRGDRRRASMVKLVLEWVAEQFQRRQRVLFGVPVLHAGKRYRVDAKAEGDKVVLGGREIRGSGSDPGRARWFSLRLSRGEIPWAYSRGDPFGSIASLELLATLLCVLAFEPEEPVLTSGMVSFSASGDNQSNGFTLSKLASTKYPLYFVLMELSEQLRSRNFLLSATWRPRDENEEADALTNEVFTGFDEKKRVEVRWSDLKLMVLPQLVKGAEALFAEYKEARRRERPKATRAAAKPARKRLRERDPW